MARAGTSNHTGAGFGSASRGCAQNVTETVAAALVGVSQRRSASGGPSPMTPDE
jgi:hypothetical protein